jgi:hypothetical protein
MNAVTTLAQSVEQTVSVQAAGMVRAESIWTWAQNQGTQAQNTINVLILVVAAIAAIVIMIRGKFTGRSIVMGLIVGGAAVWVVLGGIGWATDRIGETTQASVVLEHPGSVTAAADDGLPVELSVL